MGDELAVRKVELDRLDPRAAVAARNLDDVRRMAESIAKSGLYGCKSVDEAMIRIVTGMELGLSMLQSIRGVYVISNGNKNTPGLYADLMVGVCKSRNDICEYFIVRHSDNEKATYATKRVGEPSETVMSFTMADAKLAGLLSKGGPWQQYPAAMLRARASSALSRAVYPDLLNGLYSTEELQDMGNAAPLPVRAEIVTADGEVVMQDLDEALHASLEAEQAKLFEQLMVGLLDARDERAFAEARAAIGANKAKLSAEHLVKLGRASNEAKRALTPNEKA